MNVRFIAASCAALCIVSPAAHAATVVVDGTLDAAYGAAQSHVSYSSNAPTSNFGASTLLSNTTAYDLYTTSDANNVYFYLKAATNTGLNFANIYFDYDPQNNNGSDIGFEITNDRAFIPGVSGYSGPLAGIHYANSADGTGLEFSIANSYFTSAIAGLNYYSGGSFGTNGGTLNATLLQFDGYSVNGRPIATDTIGGSVGAVPEPAAWAMMIVGFGAVGFAMRRQRAQKPQALPLAA